MDDQTGITEIKPKNMFIPICITQIICVAVVLITVLIIKFFFVEGFAKLQHWCGDNFLEATVISDVFNEENSSEI